MTSPKEIILERVKRIDLSSEEMSWQDTCWLLDTGTLFAEALEYYGNRDGIDDDPIEAREALNKAAGVP